MNIMNIAVIFAGGTGQRMNTKTKPKQFLELHQKPIIVYTLEQFEENDEIDAIVISCLSSWLDYCVDLVHKFEIKKVKAIVPGGDTGQQSICNGLLKAKEIADNNAIVLVHDAVRPLIDQETISKAIQCVKDHGSAITVAPATETIAIMSDKNNEVGEIVDRSKCQLAKAPQCFYLEELVEAHKKAIIDNKYDFIDSACLMRYYGHSLHVVEGKSENIKITTPSDFYIFRAIIDARENSQIFGI